MPSIRVIDNIVDLSDVDLTKNGYLYWNGTSVNSTDSGIITSINNSSVIIKKGQPVSINNNNVKLASNLDLLNPASGIAIEDIHPGSYGKSIIFGYLKLQDWSNGIDNQLLEVGYKYYLENGVITKNVPSNIIQQIGYSISTDTIFIDVQPIKSLLFDHMHVSETHILTLLDISNKFILIGQEPELNSVSLSISGAGYQPISTAWSVDSLNNKKIIWSGLSLDGILESGDVIKISYRRST